MERPLSRTMHDVLAEQAERFGDRPAVVHRAGTTTFAQLHERAQQVHRAFREGGVTRHDRIGLLSTNRVEWLETCFGASAAGAAVHCLNTWVTAREMQQLLEEAQCTVLVLLHAHGRRDYLADLRALVPELWEADPGEWRSSRFPDLRTVVVVDGAAPRGAVDYEGWLADAPAPRPEPAPRALVSAAAAAVVLYTSGSTATPKAVPLLQHGMVENGFHIGERMGLTERDCVWLSSPLFWSFGCANALMATFTHGASLVLQEQFQAAAALDLIEAEQCTVAYLLPTLTRGLLSEEGFHAGRLASVRTGLTIGSPEDVRLAADELGVTGICNVYGQTESYGNCCVTPHDAPLAERLVGQGPPLPGVSLRIVDPGTDELVEAGQVGEIQVSGYLTPGYLGVEGSGAQPFTDDGFYRTGDLGSVDEQGWLHYAARSTDMIKTAGINVSPAEVEAFLLGVDGVEQVAVVGAPDETRGERVVAYVVPESGRSLDEQELIDQCRTALASYKVPTRVLVVPGLPKTGTGKLHRRELRQQAPEVSERPD